KAINHLRDCVGGDANFGAFASGMDQTNRRRFRIDDIDGAAVGDVNPEHNAALIGDDPVATGQLAARRAAATATDHCDFVVVNLFGGKYRPIADADCASNLTMGGLEAV